MGEPLREPIDPASAPRMHEPRDVSIRPLAIFVGGLAVLLVVVAALMVALFDAFERGAEQRERERAPLADERPRTIGPLLQQAPREDLETFREREVKTLGSTGWVSREAGVVRIPIERAIKLTAERGFADWPAADIAASGTSESERPSQQAVDESAEGTGQTTPVEEGATQ